MSVSSRALVELVLLGPTSDRRQLQESPVLGDVWIAFAAKPAAPMDLLITPYKERPAGPVAFIIADRVRKLGLDRKQGQRQVAYLQGLVAARLFFREVLGLIMPMTQWWHDRKVQDRLQLNSKNKLRESIDAIIKWVQADDEGTRAELEDAFSNFTALDRYFALAGIILWAGMQKGKAKVPGGGIADLLAKVKGPGPIVEEFERLMEEIWRDSFPDEIQIWQVSLNRKAMPALERSVPAVKGDAARTLFSVKCDSIKWAILDSGIDGTHDVFKDKKGGSRIVKAFDFGNIRKIVSLDNLDDKTPGFKQRLKELLTGREESLNQKEAIKTLKDLAEDANNDRPINWELVEKFIVIDPKTPPRSGHGTHVAGIIGASGRDNAAGTGGDSNFADGMCPDIMFYDFRVLAKSLEDTEFAIIAALQYIRYLNESHSYLSVHGANLSLSIPHDVRNFACGRTPICNECERLVESGVVVVAAAGNLGYQSFETKEGSYEGYTAFSITDPGNAEGVITVGATHRYRPQTYGVSFFSSRGPTGDGRLKPDLVAPGERIQSSLPDQGWGELDGTSMAAPHVSGAAAMLMARYSELIGEPRRIKQILCESATDLGRERSFQGHGMLDVLRAFQKI
jgi:hypothetical protein